jgi:hypothetical protein
MSTNQQLAYSLFLFFDTTGFELCKVRFLEVDGSFAIAKNFNKLCSLCDLQFQAVSIAVFHLGLMIATSVCVMGCLHIVMIEPCAYCQLLTLRN